MSRGALAALLLLASASGCVGPQMPPIVRTVGGTTRTGTFVAPYQYEWFVRAELAVARGDLAGAREAYEIARSGGEDDPLLLSRLADVVDRQGDRAGADALLAEGARLDPESEALALVRGEILERRGDREGAIDAYARAAQLASRGDAATLALARVLAESGHPARADEVLAAHVAAHPGSVGAARARLALAELRGDPAAIGAAARALVERAPALRGEALASARHALEAGHAATAWAILEEIPEREEDRALYVEAAIASGHREEAAMMLALAPATSADELLWVGAQWLALGMPDRAAELAEAARAAGAGTRATVLLARARIAQGRASDAAALLREECRGEQAAEVRAALDEALEAVGLPALGDEVRARGM